VPSLFSSGGQTSEQKELTKTETQAAKFGLSSAESALPTATKAISQPLDFFKALLSGDRNTVMQTLQPEISSLTSAYNTGRKTAETFSPRGGGRGASLEELPFKKAADISNLVAGARTTGATGTADIGAMLAQLGLGELGAGGGIASSTVNQLETSKQNQQQQQAAAGQSVGALIALLAGL
jgi:hypothetical protein